MSPEAAIYYLSAMIDGEGCVEFKPAHKMKSGKPRRRVTIVNTDGDLIDAVVECLDILGVRFSYHEVVRPAPRQMMMTIYISHRDAFEILNEVLDLRSQKKRIALKDIIDSYDWSRKAMTYYDR